MSGSRRAGQPAGSDGVVVLGAGPAGLTAAWQAAARGHSVTLLERADAVGGMAASATVDGITVDHGSHRLHPATPEPVLAMLRELLGDDLQARPRNGRLRIYDRWVSFPLRPRELAGAVPPRAAARIVRDAVGAPLRRRTAGSYASVLTRSLGPELYEAMYAPYALKLWGLPGTEIDAEQARVRVTADTPWKVAARTLRQRRGGGQGREFSYPRRGFGQLVTALADAGTSSGVNLRCGSPVTAIGTAEHAAVVTTADGTRHRAGRVLSTLPLPVLARLAIPAPPASAVADARALGFRAMLLVYLGHDGGRWTPYDAHYLPGPGTPVTRISEPTNYRDSADDPADRSVVCAEIPCTAGDELWNADDSTLSRLVHDAVASTGLPPLRRTGAQVRRLPHVYPVYARGFADRLAGLEAWAAGLPGVTTLGRAGLFAHDNTHHAMVMALAAVDCLTADGGWDETRWSAARERFRAHVVED